MSNLGSRQNSIDASTNMDASPNRLIPSLMNIIGYTCTGVMFIVLESGVIPAHKNGFFCNDNSIKYPLHEETVSDALLIGVNLIVGIMIIAVAEKVLVYENSSLTIYSKRRQHLLARLCESDHLWPIRAIKVCLMLTWCVFANGVVTDVFKITVGWPRPNFMAVCNPNVNCSLDNTMFNVDYICQGATQKEENSVRLSFPSGHASLAGTVMGFIATYVQIRCEGPDCFILLKPIVQLAMFILEGWICMTRVSDYQHHLIDVIFGFLLGTIIGLLGGIHTTKWLNTSLYCAGETCGSELGDKNGDVCSLYNDSKIPNKNKSHEEDSLTGKPAHMNDLEDPDYLK